MKEQPIKNKRSNTSWSLRGLIFFVFFTTAVPVMADFPQRQKITSAPRGVGAQFGYSVAIDGNTMVVGARFDSTTAASAGAAFVYVLNGTVWTQQAKLLANDGASFDKFGQSVAISGDTIVVGSYQANAPLSNGGAAYVFVRNGTTWTQQQKLTASDGSVDDEFGNAVAVAGDTIVVGAHFADLPNNASAGSAYVFTRTGTFWMQMQKLIPAGGVILGDLFGESVAMSGSRIVVGSSGADVPQTAAGSVYVFEKIGSLYSMDQKLSIPTGTNGDNFGCSVAIEGNTLVGGAREDSAIAGQVAYGSVYVFEFDGVDWILEQKLTASDGGPSDRFGWSVAVGDDLIAVGAREDDTAVGPDAGSAYLFSRTGTTWTQEEKLVPGDPFNGDRFGGSIALSSGNLVIGAAEKNLTSPNGQGAAYFFKARSGSVFPDFDGDGKADLSAFRPSNGTWYSLQAASISATPFGISTDEMAPADFDGDGKTDVAVYRAGVWYVQRSSLGFTALQFGVQGDIPIPADYDGDGKADICIFRPTNNTWYRLNSSNAQITILQFGSSGDRPVIADFDGDGKSDLALFRPSNATWNVLQSSDNSVLTGPLGAIGDIPTPADFDGDGMTDFSVYRPSEGNWYRLNSSNNQVVVQQLGAAGDKPVPADYDGDGLADIAVFRPSTSLWFLQLSTTGLVIQFGQGTDLPVPLYYLSRPSTLSNVQFNSASFTVTENANIATINLTRTGDSSRTVSVEYLAADLTAKQLFDYTTAVGTVTFGPGETSKSFSIVVVDDLYPEANESLSLTLRNPSNAATLGATSTAVLTITDNDFSPPFTNPLDNADAQFFVRQHYSDFLSREPDPGGLAYWASQITSCGNDQACIRRKRIDVSNAFFYELEFQQTGAYVYRMYRAAYGNDQPFPNSDPGNIVEAKKIPAYDVFVNDRARVVAGGNQTQAQLVLAEAFVQRPEFLARYPESLDGPQFVDAILARITIDSGSNLTSQRAALIDLFNQRGRGAVLYRLADDNVQTNPINNQLFLDAEYNRSFVYTQYAGYLRRDADLGGFLFWLGKVNEFPIRNTNIQHAMVCAFTTSAEFQQRFSPIVTHFNSECQ